MPAAQKGYDFGRSDTRPDSMDPYNGKGVALTSLRNYNQAKNCFDKAIGMDPKSINYANLLVSTTTVCTTAFVIPSIT
jgi:hypothetical protein